jgi:nicotinate-nucleotide adenylyltransferase
MGGTFDPVHLGHLVCASEVAARLSLDEVVFVPAGQPWQKPGADVSPAEDRYAMTLLATAANPAFSVSRAEIDRPGPTYTVDTLRALRAERPGDELYFIAGADALAQLATWHEAEALPSLARFVGATRPGYAPPGGGLPVAMVEIPALAISSSDCRERVRAGAPIRYLVPDTVADYIEKRSLYRAAPC